MRSWAIWLVRFAAALVMFVTGIALAVVLLFQYNPVLPWMSVLFVFGGFFSFPKLPNAWRRDPPSQRQIAYAMKLGIDVPDGVSKGELSDMISSVTGR